MKIYREIIDDFSVGWTGAAMKDPLCTIRSKRRKSLVLGYGYNPYLYDMM